MTGFIYPVSRFCSLTCKQTTYEATGQSAVVASSNGPSAGVKGTSVFFFPRWQSPIKERKGTMTSRHQRVVKGGKGILKYVLMASPFFIATGFALTYGIKFLNRSGMKNYAQATIKTLTKKTTSDTAPTMYDATVTYTDSNKVTHETTIQLAEQPNCPYTVGQQITIGYDHAKPSKIVLPPGKDEKLLIFGWVLVTFGIVTLLMGLGVITYGGFRIRKKVSRVDSSDAFSPEY